MRNPFHRQPEPFDGLEERIATVLTNVHHEQPSEAAEQSARTQLLSRLDAPPVANGQGRRRALATAGALLAPLALITVAAAMHGGGPANPGVFGLGHPGAPNQATTATATDTGTSTTTSTTTSTSTSTNTATGTATGSSTSSASGAGPLGKTTPTTPQAAGDAHTNGHGCDDTLFANGTPPFATPGGPVGCTVGNSGDHRQNGMHGSATPSPSASASPGVTGAGASSSAPGVSLSGSLSLGNSGTHISIQGQAHSQAGIGHASNAPGAGN